jgi:hypothetical protein
MVRAIANVSRGAGAALTLALLLVLGACAGPQTRFLTDASDLPFRSEVGGVPFYAQTDNYCGPATLAMVATWAGTPLTQADAAKLVYTPGKQGTFRDDMVAAARRNGLLAVPVTDMRALLREIAEGHPVIVFQNLGLEVVPVWHYAVAFGYDLDRNVILLRSGVDEVRATPLATFERTWARGDHWGLVVLPPSGWPATGTERALVEAAVGLELAGHGREAGAVYANAVQLWPDSYTAWFGLGNARYAAKDFRGSADAFRHATQLRPNDAVAWNNLAYALAGNGRFADARMAAEQAVKLAPAGGEGPYRDTLADINQLTARAAG